MVLHLTTDTRGKNLVIPSVSAALNTMIMFRPALQSQKHSSHHAKWKPLSLRSAMQTAEESSSSYSVQHSWDQWRSVCKACTICGQTMVDSGCILLGPSSEATPFSNRKASGVTNKMLSPGTAGTNYDHTQWCSTIALANVTKANFHLWWVQAVPMFITSLSIRAYNLSKLWFHSQAIIVFI